MGEQSAIEWTDHTFNPWVGCAKVSPGCKFCYAEVETFARTRRARGLELWGVGAERHVTSDANWKKPFAWDRAAAREGRRARVFCASMADVFEDRDDLRAPRARLFQLAAATSHLDWLLLTKRPENAARLWADAMRTPVPAQPLLTFESPWLPNLWLGTTCEDQARADERIPHLLATPAKVRFLSVEPMLGPVDLTRLVRNSEECHATRHCGCSGIDWVICGGESGDHARPFDLTWARGLREQCAAAKVPFFFKQAGARPYLGAQPAIDILHPKGNDLRELPEDLRIRQFPEVGP